jgi:iron complex outermembrane receptor protein
MRRALRTALLLGGACALPAAAHATTVDPQDLSELSIEELAQIEVRSASKRPEPLSEVANSFFVITDTDIIRSAATSLPEALRLAPTMHVQRIDARQYAISARGFNGYENANKLLVLIDGRSIYTTLHSGVFWELHSPLLEDLEQIEVITGPGGTLYGPNAVNGVVNVVSKDAHDTLGGLARGTAGANERTAALRYGFELGSAGALRLYANGFDRENMPAGAAPDIDDRFRGFQAGFRADFGTGGDRFTLQGDWLESDTGGVPGDGDSAQNILGRWVHGIADGWNVQAQAYYDRYKRVFLLARDELQVLDVEGQVDGTFGAHQLVAGVGVRTTKDRFVNNLNPFVLDPESKRLWIANVFVQDRIALGPTFAVTAGLKAERSSFSGVELLPNLRFTWRPTERHTLWTAVSRAVRTPSRIDRQLVFPGFLLAAADFKSEKLVALEAGYRGQIGPETSISATLFLHLYDDIRSTGFTPVTILPVQLQNGLQGNSWGIGAWVNHQLAPWWRVTAGISTLGEDFELEPGRNDLAGFASLGANPDYQIVGRSQMDLTDRLRFDVDARMVDDLERPENDSYVEANARLSWLLNDRFELYLAGSNLLHEDHAESADPNRAQRIERSIYGGTRFRF